MCFSDINECLLDDSEYPCHEKASCADSIGSYSCKCLTGWTGNGTNCEGMHFSFIQITTWLARVQVVIFYQRNKLLLI